MHSGGAFMSAPLGGVIGSLCKSVSASSNVREQGLTQAFTNNILSIIINPQFPRCCGLKYSSLPIATQLTSRPAAQKIQTSRGTVLSALDDRHRFSIKNRGCLFLQEGLPTFPCILQSLQGCLPHGDDGSRGAACGCSRQSLLSLPRFDTELRLRCPGTF